MNGWKNESIQDVRAVREMGEENTLEAFWIFNVQVMRPSKRSVATLKWGPQRDLSHTCVVCGRMETEKQHGFYLSFIKNSNVLRIVLEKIPNKSSKKSRKKILFFL
jgi:hypothetical protein